jgi:hypothetical protein
LTEKWGPWHGKAGAVHADNQTTNTARQFTAQMGLMGMPMKRSATYSPWGIGAIESYHGIMKKLARKYPFSTQAQQMLDGTPYWPDPELLPTYDEWAHDWLADVREYNGTAKPRKLEGDTPLSQWYKLPQPEPLAEEVARALATRDRLAYVKRHAITIDGISYGEPTGVLANYSRREVLVGNICRETIDVSDLKREHLCVAVNEALQNDDYWDSVRAAAESRRAHDQEIAAAALADVEDKLRKRQARRQKQTPAFEQAVDALGRRARSGRERRVDPPRFSQNDAAAQPEESG